MPVRARLRKMLSRSSSSSPSDTPNDSGSRERYPDNVYKPGEKMPPMKYRRPVAPEHKEKLESFSFAKAWRRRSHQSVYSPHGSRMPSRAPSLVGSILGRRSFASRRGNSVDEPLKEGEGEGGGPENVGLSRKNTHEDSVTSRPQSKRLSSGAGPVKSPPQSPKGSVAVPIPEMSNGHTPNGDGPFNPHDLTLALKQSHLRVPTTSS